MADDLDDLDLDGLDIDGLDIGEADGESSEASGGGKSKKLIMIGVIALLAVGGGGYFFMSPDKTETRAAESDADSGEEGEPLAAAYYFSLNPPFVVNFVGKGRAQFLQVNIDGMTRDPSVKEDITLHLPHIRNNIVMILSGKNYDELITMEGKESLRKELLAEIKKILQSETGKDAIEDIYFTNFVMQ